MKKLLLAAAAVSLLLCLHFATMEVFVAPFLVHLNLFRSCSFTLWRNRFLEPDISLPPLREEVAYVVLFLEPLDRFEEKIRGKF